MASRKEIEDRAVKAAVAGYEAMAEGRGTPSGFIAATGGLSVTDAGVEARMRRAMGEISWRPYSYRLPRQRVPRALLQSFHEFRFARARRRYLQHLTRVRRAAGTDDGAIWLALMAPDGHAREAALLRLKGPIPNAFLAGVAMRRLNDWAGPVRDAAQDAVPEALLHTPHPISGAAVAMALGQKWGRGTPDWSAFLARPYLVEAVTTYLGGTTSGPAARTLPRLLAAGHGDPALRELATAAIQPGLRAVAVRALVAGHATWAEGRRWAWIDKSMGKRQRVPDIRKRALTVARATAEETLRYARDPSARVRRAVLDGLDDARPEEMGEIAALLSDDPWPSIRHRADVLSRHRPSQAASSLS